MQKLDPLLKTLLLLELKKAGYNNACYDKGTGLITPDPNHPSIRYFQEGIIHHQSDSAYTKELARGKLRDIFDATKDAFDEWEAGRFMPGKEDEGYRILAESGSHVLAARDDGKEGLHYVTWEYSLDRRTVGNGHYTTDFAEAKRSFAERSGIADKHHLLSQEDMVKICEQLWDLEAGCLENEPKAIIDMLEAINPSLKDCRPEWYMDSLAEQAME